MMMPKKDPEAKLDYRVDWTDWLSGNDSIIASHFTVQDGLVSENDYHDGSSATVWLSGGTVGQRYAITNHISTQLGRIDERTFYVSIGDR